MPPTANDTEARLLDLGALDTKRLSGPQLQRAWALGYVRLLWPTIPWDAAQRVAAWLCGSTE